MNATLEFQQSQEYELAAFAKVRAKHYGRAIGKDAKTASKTLESIIRAYLDNMEIDEERSMPIVTGNRRQILVLRKLGECRFSTSLTVTI